MLVIDSGELASQLLDAVLPERDSGVVLSSRVSAVGTPYGVQSTPQNESSCETGTNELRHLRQLHLLAVIFSLVESPERSCLPGRFLFCGTFTTPRSC